jgi:CHASE3 domain sensor protein
VPEDVKKRIEEARKFVLTPTGSNSKEDDIRSVAFIKGMQTEILESLDRLSEVLLKPSGELFKFSQKLEKIESTLDLLESKISKIPIISYEQSIKEIKGDLERIVRKIEALDSRIASQFHQTLQETTKLKNDNEKTSIWLSTAYFIVFILLIVGGYILWQTKTKLDQKKFI